MAKNSIVKEFTKGIVKENPVLRLMLGTCATLAVTTTAINGIGMGVATTAVLICSNVVISLLRKVIPDKVRIPAYITIIAGFVTVIQMLMKAYVPAIDKSLGIYLPLIVVNCIILARAEMFASKNGVIASAADGLGMGMGFTLVLMIMGLIREIIGNGTAFNIPLTVGKIEPMIVMILPPGGFFVFGVLVALTNLITNRKKKGKDEESCSNQSACASCPSCGICHMDEVMNKDGGEE